MPGPCWGNRAGTGEGQGQGRAVEYLLPGWGEVEYPILVLAGVDGIWVRWRAHVLILGG